MCTELVVVYYECSIIMRVSMSVCAHVYVGVGVGVGVCGCICSFGYFVYPIHT